MTITSIISDFDSTWNENAGEELIRYQEQCYLMMCNHSKGYYRVNNEEMFDYICMYNGMSI